MKTEASSPTREITLSLLLKEGESSASNLASSLGISVQAMRRHLRNLQEDGLVKANQISAGPGRPCKVWQLTSEGENTFNRGNEKFALDLLNSVKRTFQEESIEKILGDQAIEKAKKYRSEIGSGTLKERIEKLVFLRQAEGYLGEYQEDNEGKGWFINEFHCSIKEIAMEHPAICDKELTLIRLTFPDCEVSRTHWRLEYGHYCGFYIIPLPSH